MTRRRRFYSRPMVWIIFAVMVGVPSVQLTRLLRERAAPTRLDSAADSPADSPGPFVYEPIGPAKAPIAAAAVSWTGRLVAVLDDSGEVTVWDVRDRKPLRTLASEQQLPMRRFQPFGVPMAVEELLGMGLEAAVLAIGGNDGRVRVWRLKTGDMMLDGAHSTRDPGANGLRDGTVVDVEAPPEAALLSVSSGGSLALWTARDSAPMWMTRSPRGNVRDVDVSTDNRAVAVASDEGVYLLTIRPFDRAWAAIESSSSDASPSQVQFSPGGGVIASVWSNGEIRVYSSATRDRLKTVRIGPEHGFGRLLAFSPDGQLLAATDGHRVIQVWSMSHSSPAVAITAPRGPVRSMWFTPDGAHLVVSAYGDRYLRSLPLPGKP
jgi:WD40 repeat protein